MKQVIRNGRCFNINSGYHADWWGTVFPDWEHDVSDFIEEHARPDKISLDIGSWNGVHAFYMGLISKMTYAIEPDPLAYKILTANLECNPAINTRLKITQCALSNESGEIEIMTGGGSGSSILKDVHDRYPNIGKELVQCMTFREYLSKMEIDPRDVGFIKMDIEGAEKLCIPDMQWFFENHYDGAMSLSLHPAFMSEAEVDYIVRIMEKHFIRVSGEGWIKKP